MISKDNDRIAITVSKDTKEQFEKYCKDNCTTKSLTLERLIQELVKDQIEILNNK